MCILFQTCVDDVPAATHAQLQHDAEVAAPRDLQLRVPHVPQHYRRSVTICCCIILALFIRKYIMVFMDMASLEHDRITVQIKYA